MSHMTGAKLAGYVRVSWTGFADHKPLGRLSVPAMGPVPLHTAECIYNRKPHSHTHTPSPSALSAGSHFSASVFVQRFGNPIMAL